MLCSGVSVMSLFELRRESPQPSCPGACKRTGGCRAQFPLCRSGCATCDRQLACLRRRRLELRGSFVFRASMAKGKGMANAFTASDQLRASEVLLLKDSSWRHFQNPELGESCHVRILLRSLPSACYALEATPRSQASRRGSQSDAERAASRARQIVTRDDQVARNPAACGARPCG